MKISILNPLRLLLVLALAPWVAPAQITPSPPGQISYQGFLTDASGIPLATNAPKNYTLYFRIYDASTGGDPIWGEQQVVTVDRGHYTVVLGSGGSIPGAPFTSDLTGVLVAKAFESDAHPYPVNPGGEAVNDLEPWPWKCSCGALAPRGTTRCLACGQSSLVPRST